MGLEYEKYAKPIVLALVTLLLVGCSSLLPQQGRNYALTTFLAQKEHFALFTPISLQSEEKLQVFGVDDVGDKFSRHFSIIRIGTLSIERCLQVSR